MMMMMINRSKNRIVAKLQSTGWRLWRSSWVHKICLMHVCMHICIYVFLIDLFITLTYRYTWQTRPSSLFANVSHQTRLDTRSIARKPIKVGISGGEGRKRAEARTLLVYVAHRLTKCHVNLVSRSLSKGINNAARPPGDSPAENGSLTALSLSLFIFGASIWTKVQNGLRRVKPSSITVV